VHEKVIDVFVLRSQRSLDGIYKKHGAIPINIVGKVAQAVLEGLTYLYDEHRIIHRGE
jgi:mitogen-activated protein kinase kinase